MTKENLIRASGTHASKNSFESLIRPSKAHYELVEENPYQNYRL